MTGTLRNRNGDEIPPTGKPFEVDFYTVARPERRADRRGEPYVRRRYLPEADLAQRVTGRSPQPQRLGVRGRIVDLLGR
jgi:hypothetical protein